MKHGYFKGNKVAECQDSQISLMNKFKNQGLVDEWRDAEAEQNQPAEAERLAAEKAAAEKAAAEKADAGKAATEKAAAEKASAEKASERKDEERHRGDKKK